MPNARFAVVAAAAFLLLVTNVSEGESYRVRSSVMGSAGAPSSDAEYRSSGTLAQPTPIGVAAGASQGLYAGFWGKHFWTASVLESDSGGTLADGLCQNHPNPFTGVTSITFSLARQAHARMAVYDVKGRRVKCLIDENIPAGNRTVTWDGSDASGVRVSPGVYFYRLDTGSCQKVKKLLVLE